MVSGSHPTILYSFFFLKRHLLGIFLGRYTKFLFFTRLDVDVELPGQGLYDL